MHSNFWAGREIARSATHIFPAICRPRHHPVRRYTLASRLPLAAVDSLSDRAGTYSSSACFPSPRDTAFLTEPAAKKSRITTLDIRCSPPRPFALSPFHSSIDGLNTSPDSLPSSSPSGASYPPLGLAFGPLEGTPPRPPRPPRPTATTPAKLSPAACTARTSTTSRPLPPVASRQAPESLLFLQPQAHLLDDDNREVPHKSLSGLLPFGGEESLVSSRNNQGLRLLGFTPFKPP